MFLKKIEKKDTDENTTTKPKYSEEEIRKILEKEKNNKTNEVSIFGFLKN
jgi:hypothetical protein